MKISVAGCETIVINSLNTFIRLQERLERPTSILYSELPVYPYPVFKAKDLCLP